MLFVWLKFIICAAIIFLAGSQLTRYADIIAEKAGFTRAWIGLVLLATITSVPELANGISAVAAVGLPDLAVGDIFGACLYNMVTLAVLSLIWFAKKKESIFPRTSFGHVLSGSFAAVLILIACAGMLLSRIFPGISLFGVGIYSVILFVVYLFAQRWIFVHEKGQGKGEVLDLVRDEEVTLGKAFFFFSVLSMFVVAAGIWLPFIGEEISHVMGWGGTFVGSIFLGLATTLPELVVSISALMLGSADMAVGNLFGSNLFNVSLLFVDDIFFTQGDLFAYVSLSNLFFGLIVIAAITVGVMSLVLKPKRIIWSSVSLFSLYLIGVYLLFRLA